MTWNWSLLDAGRFRLDGGSMFGVVPKALWSKLVSPDEQNRIPEACNCVLLERDGRHVLIETGYGSEWSEKEVDMFGLGKAFVREELECLMCHGQQARKEFKCPYDKKCMTLITADEVYLAITKMLDEIK